MSDAPELQMSDGPKHDQSDGRTNDGATASTGQAAPAARQNRRALPRRRVERLAYIRFDRDNGGILLDIGEGGLKFQGVASSLEGEFCIVKFMLPGSGRTIEVRGQIAWSNKSRKGGGVRFLDVPEDVRQQIREWMAQENTPLISTRPVSKPIVSKPPQFLTRERVKAGMTPPPSSQPAMPSLSSAPSVPVEPIVPAAPSVRIASVPVAGVRVEDGVVVSSLPTEPIVPAAKNLDSVVASATAEVPSALGPPSVLAPIRISVPPQAVGGERSEMPALFAEDVRNTKSAKSLPSRFRGITQPAATQLPTQLSAQTPQTSDWSHPATLPHSESFIAADLGALKYGQPTGISRVAQIAVVAAFVCVASVAAVVVTPRAPALLASFRGISQASTSAPVDAPAPDVTAGQDFSVDAVNSANRHWTLRNGAADDSAVASMGSAPNGAPNVSPNAGENAADDISNTPSSDVPGNLSSNANARGGAKVSAAQPGEANRIVPGEPRTKSFVPASAAQHLNLTPPKTRQVAALSSGLEAPSVVDNPLSANSLDSPLALGTHSLPAPPPVAPAPSAPATAAVASASKSALRPAVLIHSVRAVYPRDVSPSKSGSSVRVSAVIDKDGVPGSLTMVGGDPSFLGAALAAVREYRYDPALINGEPVESTVVIAVNFQQTR